MTETIQKYLSYLRYEKNYSFHTEISYSRDLTQFEEYLNNQHEDIDLLSVDKDIVRQWIASLINTGLNPRSVNRKLSSLKSFYRYLQRIGSVETNPIKKVTGPKTKSPLPSFVGEHDLETILDAEVDINDFEKFRDHVILELLYMTGMRRAELINIQDGDIDLSAEHIRVTGKRNKQRLIPFSNNTKELIEQYLTERNKLECCPSGYFFTTKTGKQLYPMLVYRIIHDALKSITTLEKASPHVLRHSFATNMLNNGAEINAVKELLGHSSLASTEVYTHTSFEELKKIYKKAHPRA